MARVLLAPGLAWPLRPAEVDVALGMLRQQVTVNWASWHRRPAADVLAAEWSPTRDSGVGVLPGSGAVLWINPIGRDAVGDDRAAARLMLVQAVRWLRDALEAGDPWKASRHERRWTLDDRSDDR